MKKEAQGIVIESNDNLAKVKVNRHGDCKNCGACPGDNATVLDVRNLLKAKPGQRVLFEIKETNILKAAFVVYMVPLIGILLGAMSGMWLAEKMGEVEKVFEIGGASLGFILAALYIKIFDKSTNTDSKMKPIITHIL